MKISPFREWKVVRLVSDLLLQGITAEKIALCAALGISLGVFPVLGTTTLLCTVAVFLFRVNLPLIQLVNYLVYPLQLILFIPFIRAGEWVFRTEPIPLSMTRLVEMFKSDFVGSIRSLWSVQLHAVAVWLVAGPVFTLLFYLVFTPLLKRLPLTGPKKERP